MSTEAPSPPEAEVLLLGAEVPDRRLRRTLTLALVILGLLAAGFVIYRVFPRPEAPMSREELQGVYAGMVRSDGTNDASLIDRRHLPTARVVVSPPECAPLFDTTLFNQMPTEGIDGVSTFWLGGSSAVSLFTVRFEDTEAADRAYDRAADALSGCVDRPVAVEGRRNLFGQITRLDLSSTSDIKQQVGYVMSTGVNVGNPEQYAVHVLAFNNTVSWQYRYDPGQDPYSPVPAQQLMDSLVSQMRSVQELRR